jgi:hypothetical protein
MWIDDIITILEDASVGVFGTTIFGSTKQSVPVGPGPYLSIFTTGGTLVTGVETHNAAPDVAYMAPTAQVVARASTWTAADTKAQEAFAVLRKVQNVEINGVWYMRIRAMQAEPFDGGLDDTGRATVKFNVMAVKRPSS